MKIFKQRLRAAFRAAAVSALWLPLSTLPAHSHDHTHHHDAEAAAPVTVSSRAYEVPDVTLKDESGRLVPLRSVLSPETPVVMNFIYTSCTSICPTMTATLLQLQERLSHSEVKPRYISISIDPEFDSPTVLKSYAERYGADWQFLTGSRADVVNVLRSFDSWRGSKANHAAVTLMRDGRATQWKRVDGLASAEELAAAWSSLGP
jgi:protein SCO1/2